MHRRIFNIPGHAHGLTFSTFGRYPFLKADRVRGWFKDAIQNARQELSFLVWAYVVMPEHVHLLIYPQSDPYDVSEILKAIKEPIGRQAIQYLVSHESPWLDRLSRPRGKKIEDFSAFRAAVTTSTWITRERWS